jgi:hypothetical protein
MLFFDGAALFGKRNDVNDARRQGPPIAAQ